MKNLVRKTAVIGLAVVAAGVVAQPVQAAVAAPPAPVASVDVQKYLGRWYQIASVPALYELQCLRNVTADYGIGATGTVTVHNTCLSVFDLKSSITGDAKPLDGTNARLNVSFLKFGETWWHNAGANYIVVGLDAGYEWAVVTDSGRRSGFVLSRTPSLSPERTAAAQASLRAAGLDPCTLKVTKQEGGRTDRAKFC
ncbi:MAG: lipocalin family protein [Streptosporangiaceae bacterium]